MLNIVRTRRRSVMFTRLMIENNFNNHSSASSFSTSTIPVVRLRRQQWPRLVPPAAGGVSRPASRPWSSSRPPRGETCPDNPSREALCRHPKMMPPPPRLNPLRVEEQQLGSKLLPGDPTPNPALMTPEPGHPTVETHFSRMYSWFCSVRSS